MVVRCVKLILALALVCSLSLPALSASAVGDLTGQQWQASTPNEKLAFLYGASSIVAIEQLLAQKKGEQPSLFVGAWIKAFNNSNWMDLKDKLDAWYAAHPDQNNRQVFDVLWHEFMVPATR